MLRPLNLLSVLAIVPFIVERLESRGCTFERLLSRGCTIERLHEYLYSLRQPFAICLVKL